MQGGYTKSILPPLLYICFAQTALADCISPAEPFLSCTMDDRDISLDVCVSGSEVQYRYITQQDPDGLVLTWSARDVDYEPWPGVGNTILEAVTFDIANYKHEIWGAIDRSQMKSNNPREAITGGINIIWSGKLSAQETCDVGSIDFTYGTIMNEAKKEANQCWDHESSLWVDC